MSSVGAWHAVGVQQTVAVNFAGVGAHPLPTREAAPTWKSFPLAPSLGFLRTLISSLCFPSTKNEATS